MTFAEMLAGQPRLSEDELAQVKAWQHAVAAAQIHDRELTTGRWACLNCTCCRWWHGPKCQPNEGCPVHGNFMVTPDGRFL